MDKDKIQTIQQLEQLHTKLVTQRKQIDQAIKQAEKELRELKGYVTLTITRGNGGYVLLAREPKHKPIYVTCRKDKKQITQIMNECLGKTMNEVWDIKEKYRKRDSKTSKKYGGTLYG